MADLPFSALPLPPPPVASSAMPASLQEIVRIACEKGHSDIHIAVGQEPRFRHRGELVSCGWPLIDSHTFRDWLREILDVSMVDGFQRRKHYEGAHTFPFSRLRIQLLHTLQGEAMVLRPIPTAIATIDELELPAVFKDLAASPSGLLLIGGARSSGRSTTAAALLDHINRNQARHILTLEDPVEFVHASLRSLIHQRQVGQHTESLSDGLAAALRGDSDVISIDGLADGDTLLGALEAAETGRLVIATLLANSAAEALEHLRRLVPASQRSDVQKRLADALVGLVIQGLVNTSEGGRTSYHEILVNGREVREAIGVGDLEALAEILEGPGDKKEVEEQEGAPAPDLPEKGVRIHSADDSLARLVGSGKVSQVEAEALRALRNGPGRRGEPPAAPSDPPKDQAWPGDRSRSQPGG